MHRLALRIIQRVVVRPRPLHLGLRVHRLHRPVAPIVPEIPWQGDPKIAECRRQDDVVEVRTVAPYADVFCRTKRFEPRGKLGQSG